MSKLNEYVTSIPTVSGKISEEDSKKLSDIIYICYADIIGNSEISNLSKATIDFVVDSKLKKFCIDNLRALTQNGKDVNKDNLVTMAKFIHGDIFKPFIYGLNYNKKVINWPKLTSLIVDKGFNLDKSELFADMIDFSQKWKSTYEKSLGISAN